MKDEALLWHDSCHSNIVITLLMVCLLWASIPSLIIYRPKSRLGKMMVKKNKTIFSGFQGEKCHVHWKSGSVLCLKGGQKTVPFGPCTSHPSTTSGYIFSPPSTDVLSCPERERRPEKELKQLDLFSCTSVIDPQEGAGLMLLKMYARISPRHTWCCTAYDSSKVYKSSKTHHASREPSRNPIDLQTGDTETVALPLLAFLWHLTTINLH